MTNSIVANVFGVVPIVFRYLSLLKKITTVLLFIRFASPSDRSKALDYYSRFVNSDTFKGFDVIPGFCSFR